ncbi:hypothetical protein EJV47_12920 [Hymenobacter gummosus]|uniref:Uncharacterized protein n=1 Tax=Hymenobacter gummosus TaxID=1776032 RepID=A0A431U2V9_9BACT|nr:hypothetical protein [Hymenobacter gummosus]RTQ49710.1 hypothetical protein EJV47_12920 [Hymenobacter gummosus]
MKRVLHTAGLLLALVLLPLLGAGLYDLTAPAAPHPAPAAPRPLLRPALLRTAPSPTSSAPQVYAA